MLKTCLDCWVYFIFLGEIFSMNASMGPLHLRFIPEPKNYKQGDQLNMACFSGTLDNMTFPVYSGEHWTSQFIKGIR